MKYILAFISFILISSPAQAQDTSYERVMSSGEIKCGYVIYPPLFDRDVNTNEFHGMNYEIMEAVGEKLDLKINWVEEVGTDNAFSGLNTGRYDAVCIGFWEIAKRARAAMFTDTLYYEGLYAFAKSDDTRFDQGKETINTEGTTIVVLEGEMSQFISQEEFPKAKTVTQPGITGAAVRFLDVANGKGDVTFNELAVYDDYNKENPGKIKQLYPEPLRINGAAFSVNKGEHTLLQMLNSALFELHNTGKIKSIIQKYNAGKNIYLPAAKPYEVKQ